MPKNIFCAQCGTELFFVRKAAQGNIYEMIEPHTCTVIKDPSLPNNEVIPVPKAKPSNRELDAMFDSFEFVKKIDGLKSGKLTGDLRAEGSIREEKPPLVKSSAPQSLLDVVKGK